MYLPIGITQPLGLASTLRMTVVGWENGNEQKETERAQPIVKAVHALTMGYETLPYLMKLAWENWFGFRDRLGSHYYPLT